jgi:tetratricopeptide (TPR) repeat protein
LAQAIDDFELVMKKRPDFDQAYYYYALVGAKLSEQNNARISSSIWHALNALIQLNPNYEGLVKLVNEAEYYECRIVFKLYQSQGSRYSEDGLPTFPFISYEEIINWFSHVIRKRPREVPLVLAYRGQAHYEVKKFELAIADLKEAIRICDSEKYSSRKTTLIDDVNVNEVYSLLAKTFFRVKNYSSAIENFQLSDTHLGNDVFDLYEFAMSKLEVNDVDGASQLCDRIWKLRSRWYQDRLFELNFEELDRQISKKQKKGRWW